jgi:hypothetical protein
MTPMKFEPTPSWIKVRTVTPTLICWVILLIILMKGTDPKLRGRVIDTAELKLSQVNIVSDGDVKISDSTLSD